LSGNTSANAQCRGSPGSRAKRRALIDHARFRQPAQREASARSQRNLIEDAGKTTPILSGRLNAFFKGTMLDSAWRTF